MCSAVAASIVALFCGFRIPLQLRRSALDGALATLVVEARSRDAASVGSLRSRHRDAQGGDRRRLDADGADDARPADTYLGFNPEGDCGSAAAREAASRRRRARALPKLATSAYGVQVKEGKVKEVPNGITFAGGVPIMRGSEVIGAVGTSGVQAIQDEQIPQAGANAIKSVRLKPDTTIRAVSVDPGRC